VSTRMPVPRPSQRPPWNPLPSARFPLSVAPLPLTEILRGVRRICPLKTQNCQWRNHGRDQRGGPGASPPGGRPALLASSVREAALLGASRPPPALYSARSIAYWRLLSRHFAQALRTFRNMDHQRVVRRRTLLRSPSVLVNVPTQDPAPCRHTGTALSPNRRFGTRPQASNCERLPELRLSWRW